MRKDLTKPAKVLIAALILQNIFQTASVFALDENPYQASNQNWTPQGFSLSDTQRNSAAHRGLVDQKNLIQELRYRKIGSSGYLHNIRVPQDQNLSAPIDSQNPNTLQAQTIVEQVQETQSPVQDSVGLTNLSPAQNPEVNIIANSELAVQLESQINDLNSNIVDLQTIPVSEANSPDELKATGDQAPILDPTPAASFESEALLASNVFIEQNPQSGIFLSEQVIAQEPVVSNFENPSSVAPFESQNGADNGGSATTSIVSQSVFDPKLTIDSLIPTTVNGATQVNPDASDTLVRFGESLILGGLDGVSIKGDSVIIDVATNQYQANLSDGTLMVTQNACPDPYFCVMGPSIETLKPGDDGYSQLAAKFVDLLINASKLESDPAKVSQMLQAAVKIKRLSDVTDLYRSILNRAPDLGGLVGWAGSDLSLPDIKEGFYRSPEFQGIASSQGDSVAQVRYLYRSILGREGEEAGVQGWANSGLSMDQLVEGFVTSEEFAGIRDQYYRSDDFKTLIGLQGDRVSQVRYLYKSMLGRDGEEAGVQGWAASPLSTDQLIEGFISSEEYHVKHHSNRPSSNTFQSGNYTVSSTPESLQITRKDPTGTIPPIIFEYSTATNEITYDGATISKENTPGSWLSLLKTWESLMTEQRNSVAGSKEATLLDGVITRLKNAQDLRFSVQVTTGGYDHTISRNSNLIVKTTHGFGGGSFVTTTWNPDSRVITDGNNRVGQTGNYSAITDPANYKSQLIRMRDDLTASVGSISDPGTKAELQAMLDQVLRDPALNSENPDVSITSGDWTITSNANGIDISNPSNHFNYDAASTDVSIGGSVAAKADNPGGWVGSVQSYATTLGSILGTETDSSKKQALQTVKDRLNTILDIRSQVISYNYNITQYGDDLVGLVNQVSSTGNTWMWNSKSHVLSTGDTYQGVRDNYDRSKDPASYNNALHKLLDRLNDSLTQVTDPAQVGVINQMISAVSNELGGQEGAYYDIAIAGDPKNTRYQIRSTTSETEIGRVIGQASGMADRVWRVLPDGTIGVREGFADPDYTDYKPGEAGYTAIQSELGSAFNDMLNNVSQGSSEEREVTRLKALIGVTDQAPTNFSYRSADNLSGIDKINDYASLWVNDPSDSSKSVTFNIQVGNGRLLRFGNSQAIEVAPGQSGYKEVLDELILVLDRFAADSAIQGSTRAGIRALRDTMSKFGEPDTADQPIASYTYDVYRGQVKLDFYADRITTEQIGYGGVPGFVNVSYDLKTRQLTVNSSGGGETVLNPKDPDYGTFLPLILHRTVPLMTNPDTLPAVKQASQDALDAFKAWATSGEFIGKSADGTDSLYRLQDRYVMVSDMGFAAGMPPEMQFISYYQIKTDEQRNIVGSILSMNFDLELSFDGVWVSNYNDGPNSRYDYAAKRFQSILNGQ